MDFIKQIIVWLFFISPLNHSAIANPMIYKFGVVPQYSAQRIHEIWQPIMVELEKHTGIKFLLAGSPTIPAFEKQFLNGEFDFAYMNPFHAIKAIEVQQYTPMLRDIAEPLIGILVVKKNSQFHEVRSLNGQSIAFPAPNAVGASLMPRAELQRRYHIKIEPHYVQSHSSVYLNVALGRVAAGGGVQKTFNQQSSAIKDKLRIIYQTEKIASHPLVAHQRISLAHVNLIKKTLLELANTEHGKKLLHQVPIKQLGKAQLSDYSSLMKLHLEEFYIKE